MNLEAYWWEAASRREFLVQRCAVCGHHQHYPRTLCTGCGGPTPDWVLAAGTGTVDSCTVVVRGAPVPYVVARVRLTEGPVVLTHLVGAPEDSWRCDEPVVLHWQERDDGGWLPVFRRPTHTETGA